MYEYWSQVADFPDYQVSNLGRVRRITYYRSTWKGRIRKSYPTRGYRSMVLFRAGERFSIPVHVLVARAFIPNPLALPEVNHKDLNKHNNAVSNLEWMTTADNKRHAAALGVWQKPHRSARHINAHGPKWQVIIQGKYHGTFANYADAETKRAEVLNL